MASPATRTAFPHLVITGPSTELLQAPLELQKCRLGRSKGNDLAFPGDSRLSRDHLLFELIGGTWTVRDLASKHGTLVNGRRISEVVALANGDCLSAGDLRIVFVNTEDPSQHAGDTVVFIDSDTTGEIGLEVDLKTALAYEVVESPKSTQEAHLKAFVRAGLELVSHSSMEELFRTILDISVQAVGASRGILLTLEKGELVTRSHVGEGFRISTGVVSRLFESKSSLLVQDAALDQYFSSRESIVVGKVKSVIAVPLQTEERVIGMIYVDSPDHLCPFSADDLNLLTVMANVAAIRIEHARLVEIEQTDRILTWDLQQASELQSSLLPLTSPDVIGFDLAGYNCACRGVGGDYYDFLPFPDGRMALIIGDVAGKGMPAALLMSSLQARSQVIFEDGEDLVKRVERLNRAVAAHCPKNRFITFFVAVLHPQSGGLTFCNAGHNPALLVRKNGEVEALDTAGLILGISLSATYEQRSARINCGDMLILFSDGVTEACNPRTGEEFGEGRLSAVAQKHRHERASLIVDAVVREIATFTEGASPADDITLVIASRDRSDGRNDASD